MPGRRGRRRASPPPGRPRRPRPDLPGHRGPGWLGSAAVPGPAMVEGKAVVKRFGTFTAVDGIDFRVDAGEAFGFLGPNGAGKTSTMRMIGCVSPRSAGDLTVLGMDPAVD